MHLAEFGSFWLNLLHLIQIIPLTDLIFLPCTPHIAVYWQNNNKTLPTLEEMLAIWDVASEDPPAADAPEEEKKAYQHRVNMLEWYLEQYLAKTCFPKWFSATIRTTSLLTDLIRVEGEDKVYVTPTMEGYGLMQWQNSRDKYAAVFEWKAKNGWKKAAPEYDEDELETEPFKQEWSDDKKGQQSGWDPMAKQVLQERIDHVVKQRAADAQNGKKAQKFAMKLCQKANNVDPDANKKKSAKKKRSTAEREWTQEDEASEDEEFGGFLNDWAGIFCLILFSFVGILANCTVMFSPNLASAIKYFNLSACLLPHF